MKHHLIFTKMFAQNICAYRGHAVQEPFYLSSKLQQFIFFTWISPNISCSVPEYQNIDIWEKSLPPAPIAHQEQCDVTRRGILSLHRPLKPSRLFHCSPRRKILTKGLWGTEPEGQLFLSLVLRRCRAWWGWERTLCVSPPVLCQVFRHYVAC